MNNEERVQEEERERMERIGVVVSVERPSGAYQRMDWAKLVEGEFHALMRDWRGRVWTVGEGWGKVELMFLL